METTHVFAWSCGVDTADRMVAEGKYPSREAIVRKFGAEMMAEANLEANVPLNTMRLNPWDSLWVTVEIIRHETDPSIVPGDAKAQ